MQEVPASFMCRLDRAKTAAELDELAKVLPRVRCPFRQRQALYEVWKKRSEQLNEESRNV